MTARHTIPQVRRAVALGAAMLALAAASAAAAPAKQPVLKGWHNGESVSYFDFDTIKLKGTNPTSQVWLVRGGPSSQRTIFATVPGKKGYSALHRVSTVSWKAGATPRALRSVAQVRAAASAGEVSVVATKRVVNAPILGFGQTRHAGWARGKRIAYYELGVVNVAPGNEVLPIYTFKNGVAGQKNIADTEPGTTAYPPLWSVTEATWKTGKAREVRSFEDLKAAEAAGDLTLKDLPMIVNCPFL